MTVTTGQTTFSAVRRATSGVRAAGDSASLASRSGANLHTVAARRADVLGSLECHEDNSRRSLETMKPAQADAVWDAVWQLRLDLAAALDRCEKAEREAKWARDD